MEPRRRGRPRHPDILTPAEWRVLDALREGGTNAEIAARLGLSPDTVKTHISHMLAKLELRNRRALAAWRPDARPRRLGGVLPLPAALWSLGRPLALVGAGVATVAGIAVVAVALVALEVIVEGDLQQTGDGPAGTPAPTSTAAPAATSSPTPTPQPSPTATPTPTPTATPSAASSPTPTPTPTPTPDVEFPPGEVVTLAGRAMEWGPLDGVRAAARFGSSWTTDQVGIDVAPDGSVIVVEYFGPGVRRITRDGTVATIAFHSRGLTDVAVAADGSLYLADRTARRIYRVLDDGTQVVVAGGGPAEPAQVEIRDGPADEAVFVWPRKIAFSPDGDLYILEQHVIRRLSPSGWVSTFAGGEPGHADGPRAEARFSVLLDIDVDDAGNVYVLDRSANLTGGGGSYAAIRRIDTAGMVRTLYQSSPPHLGGQLATPLGLAVTGEGEIYIANTGRDQIALLTPDGELRAVAGTGDRGYLDGAAAGAAFTAPAALALADDGTLFVTDQAGSVVRGLNPGPSGSLDAVPLAGAAALPRLEGVGVEVFAGQLGRAGFAGDGGPARAALLSGPKGLALGHAGNVLVADSRNHAVRRIATDGTITTLAGGNGQGTVDGPRDEARFDWPGAVAIGVDGVVYVAENLNESLRTIAPDGSVSTARRYASGRIHAIASDARGGVFIARSNEVYRRSADGSTQVVEYDRYGGIYGLGVDGDGSVLYVDVDAPGASLVRVTSDGKASTLFADQLGVYGGALSSHVQGLAVAADGSVYAADRVFERIVRIAPDGTAAIVADYETFGSLRVEPAGILATRDGDLLVSDGRQSVIWKITIE